LHPIACINSGAQKNAEEIVSTPLALKNRAALSQFSRFY